MVQSLGFSGDVIHCAGRLLFRDYKRPLRAYIF